MSKQFDYYLSQQLITIPNNNTLKLKDKTIFLNIPRRPSLEIAVLVIQLLGQAVTQRLTQTPLCQTNTHKCASPLYLDYTTLKIVSTLKGSFN